MDINRLCLHPITKGAIAQHKKCPNYLILWHKMCNAFFVPAISARYPKCGKNVATLPRNIQLSVTVSVPGTDSQIYHLEAIDTSFGAYNPVNFTIYWNSGMINRIGSYGYWDVSCWWHGEQIANDVILANDGLFFELLF